MNLFKHKRLWFLFGIALLILVLDQLSKSWIVKHFQDERGQMVLYENIEVTSFFRITRRHNCGVAFSMGKQSQYADCRDIGAQRWILSGLVFLVSLGLMFWITRLDREKQLEALGLSLILGGALGNLWDRVLLGYVVDFIVVHHAAWPWPEFPAFNVADSAISCGAGVLILDLILNREGKASAQNDQSKNGDRGV